MTDSEKYPEVDVFVSEMKRTLELNSGKGGWRSCSPNFLLMRLKQEVLELEEAMRLRQTEDIAGEATDVANFAMMIFDKIKRAL